MIYFFIGTKAQLIKMAPLILEARQRKLPYRYIDSGQHPCGSKLLLDILSLHEPHLWLNTGDDLSTIPRLVLWFMKLLFRALFRPSWIRKNIFPDPGICLVHGDTATTLLGLFFAKRIGIRVAHVEAGLRSWSYMHPFPEEIVRVVCMHSSDILFAPEESAEMNLRKMKVKAQIYNVGANTILDTLRLIEKTTITVQIPQEPFALVSCHRFELIYSRRNMKFLIKAIEVMRKKMLVVFSVHEPTENRLRRYGLWDKLKAMEKVLLLPPQNYVNFVALERHAEYVVADGGSIQEETYYLGVPCLIFRYRTERGEGLDTTAALAQFDISSVASFLDSYSCYSNDRADFEQFHPSRTIMDRVVQET